MRSGSGGGRLYSLYLSAICLAFLKILTNMGRVSFPVWVFWFEG